VLVRLKVTPKARRAAIGDTMVEPDGSLRLKVAVTAAPAGGAANDAVIALLSKEWRLPKSALTVAAGAADRRKTLRIAGDAAALLSRLDAWWAVRNRSDA
jgi:uncharacterized protein YggU (UPF0235/DUF167 family)